MYFFPFLDSASTFHPLTPNSPITQQIQDSAAVSFTRAFYLAVLSGNTVQQSFDIAREALKASPFVADSLLEGEKFILLPDGSRDPARGPLMSHDVPVFKARPVAAWPAPGQLVFGPRSNNDDFETLGSLPQPPLDFEGREIDMHRTITTVLARRLVSLVGDEGAGKSALAAAVCTYMADRGMFENGVVFVRAQNVLTHAGFLAELDQTLRAASPRLAARLDSAPLHDAMGSSGSPEQIAEERIFSCLGGLKQLLVIDNIDRLLAEGVAASVFKIFLGELVNRTKHLKVLITASSTLGMRHVSGFGVVEHCVSLGPLTLRSALRIYAHLAPSLTTVEAKTAFVNALLPLKQMHVTVDSRELSVVAAQILALVGNGHPSRIVKAACESTPDSVAKLKAHGEQLLQAADAYVLGNLVQLSPRTSLANTLFPPPPTYGQKNLGAVGTSINMNSSTPLQRLGSTLPSPRIDPFQPQSSQPQPFQSFVPRPVSVPPQAPGDSKTASD